MLVVHGCIPSSVFTFIACCWYICSYIFSAWLHCMSNKYLLFGCLSYLSTVIDLNGCMGEVLYVSDYCNEHSR